MLRLDIPRGWRLALGSAGLLLAGCMQEPPPPTVNVASPAEGSAFAPGEAITLELHVENFALLAPADHDAAAKGAATAHENGEAEHEAEHMEVTVVASEGHYHIYLDDARGSDEHVTAWTHEVDVPLPADLAVGTHLLRIELRDNHHNEIGVESTWEFECVEP